MLKTTLKHIKCVQENVNYVKSGKGSKYIMQETSAPKRIYLTHVGLRTRKRTKKYKIQEKSITLNKIHPSTRNNI